MNHIRQFSVLVIRLLFKDKSQILMGNGAPIIPNSPIIVSTLTTHTPIIHIISLAEKF